MEEEEERPRKTSPKITPIKQARRSGSGGMEVCVIKPTSIEDGREITETLLANRTVVLNLEGIDVDVAQRIIDFASGSCFAINGNLQKISQYIFIITAVKCGYFRRFSGYLHGSVDVPGSGKGKDIGCICGKANPDRFAFFLGMISPAERPSCPHERLR